MASQNFNLEVRYSNGIPKLYVDVTDKFNVTVNKFSYNNVVYIHIYRKGKTLSLPFEDLEELVGLIPTIKGKLSLLETVSILCTKQLMCFIVHIPFMNFNTFLSLYDYYFSLVNRRTRLLKILTL
ncbi:hypothetical protein FSP39_014210 [Pinctada imbricata]|uniref:Uncharacterized protein n=1 Tax=Pinctada imbricata TaxID=66713 RepID=A0AA89CC50_PINIB|nr:hypothetical protein FSP39_014210 [Pinctada imbricata]